ncbi:Protein CBR-WDFY-2 [Caenorhabditis briggsae]|uniref:WD repeat and FYVE domain-containing protein 2 n=4 Tax=Caenorhabditis briggsae TaxID=6238 RepID=WDFY2_CAEBR|nr:Protein CBR-WDFY-2 [Caenorhabditis briggsae]A8XXC7.2 RecName: Full=WD repeat and FYVE domain-containing protein 2 [Caenorhabditis briggsae]UMM15885.1 hypothetical protein L5515_013129 [Caenorhabditis briggsae]CAP37296.2 Protein CBR-WDFY-2 [Caenorhabditis briggsae]
MAAIINQRVDQGESSMGGAKPTLLHKIAGHVARINDVILLSKDEGVWTASDDRSVRLYLKRDNDQFWPSIHHFMPVAPTCLFYSEETYKLLVGLINGNVYEFNVADDFNSMTESRKWTCHAGPISGLGFALSSELIFSCSRDKSIVWHCSENSNKVGSYLLENSCTAMVIDLPFVFVGDHGGHVTVLRIIDNQPNLVSKLSAHTNSITSLTWDGNKKVLYSGSSDHLIIMWDIGGGKGEAYELNGHNGKVTTLCAAPAAKRLFSADEHGKLMCWDMDVRRVETPEWKTSDCCQKCNQPFFWNLQAMWQRKVVGLRQHHCRTCGSAVCGSCCDNWTTYPPMGYETKVRICNDCAGRMKENPGNFDLTPLAIPHEIRTGITAMHLQETLGLLVTSGQNRVVMIWDVRSVCSAPSGSGGH